MKAAEQSGRSTGTDQRAFFPRDTFHQAIGFFRADLKIRIRDRVVINRRAKRGLHVLPALQTVKGRVGLKAYATNRWIKLFQPARSPHECSACSESRHEMRDA